MPICWQWRLALNRLLAFLAKLPQEFSADANRASIIATELGFNSHVIRQRPMVVWKRGTYTFLPRSSIPGQLATSAHAFDTGFFCPTPHQLHLLIDITATLTDWVAQAPSDWMPDCTVACFERAFPPPSQPATPAPDPPQPPSTPPRVSLLTMLVQTNTPSAQNNTPNNPYAATPVPNIHISTPPNGAPIEATVPWAPPPGLVPEPMDISDSLPAINDDDPISDTSPSGSPVQQPHISDPIQDSTAATLTNTRQISLLTPNNESDEPSTRRRRASLNSRQGAPRANNMLPRPPPTNNRRVVLWSPFEGMGTAMLALCTILSSFGMTNCLAAAWYCETTGRDRRLRRGLCRHSLPQGEQGRMGAAAFGRQRRTPPKHA